jgi:tetratricopeptide (TPR) repeat protein
VTWQGPVEREALGLLEHLFTKPLRKADVVDYLLNAPTVHPAARQLALAQLERYREESEPEPFHRASWAVVRQPYLNAIQYRFALRQAVTACGLAPENGHYRRTLGAAHYRTGDGKAAVAALGKATQLRGGGDSTDAFFLALAHAQLGETAPARQWYDRAVQWMGKDKPRDVELQRLRAEAAALLGINNQPEPREKGE